MYLMFFIIGFCLVSVSDITFLLFELVSLVLKIIFFKGTEKRYIILILNTSYKCRCHLVLEQDFLVL